MKPFDSTTVRMFWLLVVLLVFWAWWSVRNRPRIVHSPSLTGGESIPTSVTTRRLSVRNVSTTPVRFSKLGLFAIEDDAKRNLNELLAPNQSTIRLYTNGLTPFRGRAIAWSTDVYDAVSAEHFVSLLPNTALVIELLTDVSFSAVRLGVVDATPDPRPCRLKWETGTGSQPITSATFTPMFLTFASGDVQNQTFLNADGTHIAPNGIYTTSLITFSDVQAAASKAAAEKAAVDKATADKAAVDKATADKAAADKVAADKAAADKVAADKVAADKVAADKVAADKVAADKVAADKVAAIVAMSGIPTVCFTTANGVESVTTTGSDGEFGKPVASWGQTGIAGAPSIKMVPAAKDAGPTEPQTQITLMPRVWGNYPAILTRGPFCLATSSEIKFGGTQDINLTYTMYVMSAPLNGDTWSAIIGGYSLRADGTGTRGQLSGLLRMYGSGVAGGTDGTAETPGNPFPQGSRLFFPEYARWKVPPVGKFEIWCFAKCAGHQGLETYRNNENPHLTTDAMRAMTSAPPCISSYWRLGDGSTYSYANNGTFTGAFRVYDRYHDAKARAKVQADIEAEFQQAAA